MKLPQKRNPVHKAKLFPRIESRDQTAKNPNQKKQTHRSTWVTQIIQIRKQKKRQRNQTNLQVPLVDTNLPNCIEVYEFNKNVYVQVIAHDFLVSRMKSKPWRKQIRHHSSSPRCCRRRRGLNIHRFTTY